MANRERGERRLAVGDRSLTLRLTIAACCEVEDRSGKSLDALIASVNAGSVKALRWMLWASLQDHHAIEVGSIDEVGRLMDAVGNVPAVLKLMVEFLEANVDDRPTKETGKGTGKPATWRDLYIETRAGGLTAVAFWELSLLELWREVVILRERQREQINRDIRVAWYTAALSDKKKLPPLDRLLIPKRDGATPAAPKQQTWQEMKAFMQSVSAERAASEDKHHGRRSTRHR